MGFAIKRIYAPATPDDGARILVDKLWPRGVSKQRAALAEWMQDVAPSTKLREWFGHEADKMPQFAANYRRELETDPAKRQAVQQLLAMETQGRVTLLYGAKDPAINQAAVLKAFLEEQAAKAQ